MMYKVVAETTPDCDCEDCRTGLRLYSLFRWRDGQWMYVGISLVTYASPQDCMRNHWWGIQFEPDAVWDDGSPVVPPGRSRQQGRRARSPDPGAWFSGGDGTGELLLDEEDMETVTDHLVGD
jgi:hypothetical protein